MKKPIAFLILIFIIFSFKNKKDDYSTINQDSELQQSIRRGKEIYKDMCLFCHLPNGQGNKKFPPLAKSDYLMEKREESIRAIKFGLKGEIVVNGITYNGFMANPGLDIDEIADVMNYITNSWGNKNAKRITIEEVEDISKN
jgi:mono/diheme cytochrome c family protein